MTQTAYWCNYIGTERAVRGLTREQVAERSGIDFRLYVEIEEGHLVPKFEEFERIRASLDDIDPHLLYPGRGELNNIGSPEQWEDQPDFKRFAHPDRYLAASRLGETQAIVDQTCPIWTAWGMSEERAYETARGMFDPVYQTVGACSGCGRGPGERCEHPGTDVISIDVLRGAM